MECEICHEKKVISPTIGVSIDCIRENGAPRLYSRGTPYFESEDQKIGRNGIFLRALIDEV